MARPGVAQRLAFYNRRSPETALSSPSAGRQIALLALCQALLYVNNVTLIAINGLAGLALAPTPLLATLPVTTYIVGSALTTVPASLAMGRWGRRAGFMFGAGAGLLGTAIAAWSVLNASFLGLVSGTFVVGVYNAFGQYLRFAAADVADALEPSLKDRAIAWVLAGGIAGGIVGPELSKLTRGLLPTVFAGSYLALSLVAVIACLVASRLHIPLSHATAHDGPARPLGAVVRQPLFIVAVAVGAISYGSMSLLMTATPLAMQVCGFAFGDTAFVLEWHVIGMFAPGFVTGHLIHRFGVLRIMGAGVVLNAVCVAVALSGIELHHFTIALFLLGVGWNFLFTGSTTLALQAYRPEEKDRAQAALNFCVFATMALTSFASGALVTTQGWTLLNWGSLLPIALTGLALLWLALHRRTPALERTTP